MSEFARRPAHVGVVRETEDAGVEAELLVQLERAAQAALACAPGGQVVQQLRVIGQLVVVGAAVVRSKVKGQGLN